MIRFYVCPLETITDASGETIIRPRIYRYLNRYVVYVPPAAIAKGWCLVQASGPDHSAAAADGQLLQLPVATLDETLTGLTGQQRNRIQTALSSRGVTLPTGWQNGTFRQLLTIIGDALDPGLNLDRFTVRDS
jgi:hypothetical protein